VKSLVKITTRTRCAAHCITLALCIIALSVPRGAGAAVPSCAIASGGPGAPAILINHQPHAPIFMCVNNQFGRDEVLVEQIRQAGAVGINLISFNLFLDWHQTSDEAAATLARFCDANPKAYFYLRIWVGPNAAWLKDHPGEQITAFDGRKFPMASPSSRLWREEASRQLARRVEEIVRGPYADRFIGVMPSYLETGEWFYPETNEYWDYSDANQQAFRRWLKAKYRRNKALQRAWQDDAVTFDTAEVPSPQAREAAALGPFRDPVAHAAATDLALFQSDTIVDAIEELCRTVKKKTRGRALTGTFYGYTFEINHNGPRAMAHSGHLAFARLLESPDVDLIHAPYSYLERKLGQPGHFHLPLDSVPLHKKLVVLEEDSFTHLGVKTPEDALAPGWDQRTTTMTETLALSRRNFANFMTHRAGFWFFDLLSDGRWLSEEFWKQSIVYRRVAAELRNYPLFEPEIAFLVDETSVAAIADTTYPYLLQSLGLWRSELGRIGAPVGYYLQSDLEKLPRSVKLLILANPYHINRQQERHLRRRIEEGATVVWTFAPGIVEADGLNPSQIGRLTGIEVAHEEGQGPLQLKLLETNELWDLPEDWRLRFHVTDPHARPLAHYVESQTPAVAEVAVKKGFSVYTAVPRLPVGLLQRFAARAGVHLYRPNGGMVGVVGDYLFVHGETGASEIFCWPEPMGRAVRLVPAGIVALGVAEGGCWQDGISAGMTSIYRLEKDKFNESRALDYLQLLE
jgi:hypothetical protein